MEPGPKVVMIWLGEGVACSRTASCRGGTSEVLEVETGGLLDLAQRIQSSPGELAPLSLLGGLDQPGWRYVCKTSSASSVDNSCSIDFRSSAILLEGTRLVSS